MTDFSDFTPAPLPRIAIVVPCYNEEQALPITAGRLIDILDRLADKKLAAADSFILCVNDGSRDKTWQQIEALHSSDNRIKGISLSRNRGHQNALLAGLVTAQPICDAAVSIDADLQDDPDAIIRMVQEYHNGCEIVYGVRENRDSDSWFKRTSAHAFYNLQQSMGLDTVYDHADYRLMSSRAISMLEEFGESNLFLRGIIPMIGLKTAIVTYVRAPRVAGESKYPLAKMLSFSIDGITSFSARPMRIIFFLGLFLLTLDIAVALYVFISYFKHSYDAGWPSLMLSVWFLGSIILMSIGIVGEYIGKIFVEVKGRPRYFISKSLIN